MRPYFLIAFLFVLPAAARALPIPNDAQLAFVALGGGIGGGVDLVCDLQPKTSVLNHWYVRLPLEVVEAGLLGYFLQAQTGAIRTPENDMNRATCSALGAAGAWTISFGAGGK